MSTYEPPKDSINSPFNNNRESETDLVYNKVFVPSRGLTSAEAEHLLIQYGRNELEDKKTPKVGLNY